MGIIVQDAIDEVREILVDAAKGLYTDLEIGEKIHEGELAVGYLRPDELSAEMDFTLAPRTRQTLPAGCTHLREVLHNRGRTGELMDGPPIRLVERGVLDSFMDWRAAPAGQVVYEYMYDERHPRQFDVYPPMTDGSTVIRIDCEREPPAYAYTGLELDPDDQETTISAKYLPALVEWALYRLLSRQDDVTAAMVDGSNHYSRFFELLGISMQSDAAVSLKRRLQLE